MSRNRELVASGRDGRCVVLLYKIGSTVYYSVGASTCRWTDIDYCDEYCDGWRYIETQFILEEHEIAASIRPIKPIKIENGSINTLELTR